MRIINGQNYIRKSTIENDSSIGGSYRDRIEASSQNKAALLEAAKKDIYYKRYLKS